MNQLRSDDNLDLPIYGLRSRIHQLTRFTSLLTFRRSLSEN